ncbi:DUF6086 family protein [Streptomyces inhibens]
MLPRTIFQRWRSTTSRAHDVMAALPEGFVATVLVLAERAGIEVN